MFFLQTYLPSEPLVLTFMDAEIMQKQEGIQLTMHALGLVWINDLWTTWNYCRQENLWFYGSGQVISLSE